MSRNSEIDRRHPEDKSNLPPPPPPEPIEPDPTSPKPEPPDNELDTAERPDLDWAEHED